MNNDALNEALLDEDLSKIKPTNRDEALALIEKKKKQKLLRDRKSVTTFPKADHIKNGKV